MRTRRDRAIARLFGPTVVLSEGHDDTKKVYVNPERISSRLWSVNDVIELIKHEDFD